MKNKVYLLGSFLLLLGCNNHPSDNQSIFQPYVDILDQEALSLVDRETEIKTLAGGFSWTEGPLWVENGTYLLFSDIPSNKVYKMTQTGDTSLYLFPSGYTGEKSMSSEPGSNALLLDNDNNLVLLQHGDRRVAKMTSTIDNPAPFYSTLTERYEGKRLNSPNDGVFDSQGNLYFTDPPYGLPKGENDPHKELSFQGVYCLKTNGELILLDSLSRPNGIALSMNEQRLLVAVSDPDHAVWYSYVITAPGKVGNRKLFHDASALVGKEGQQGLPDGMKMHPNGFLFATGPGGVWVFNEGGKAIARIFTGQATSNCAFSSDYKTLYLTADDYIMSVSLK